MAERRSAIVIDEVKTRRLLGRSTAAVAEHISRHGLVSLDRKNWVKIGNAEPFAQVGPRYTEAFRGKTAGDLLAYNLVRGARKTVQSLLVTKMEEEPGSCVRLQEGSMVSFTRQDGSERALHREGDIAKALGITPDGMYRVAMTEGNNFLYIVEVNPEKVAKANSPKIDTDRARDSLVGLFT